MNGSVTKTDKSIEYTRFIVQTWNGDCVNDLPAANFAKIKNHFKGRHLSQFENFIPSEQTVMVCHCERIWRPSGEHRDNKVTGGSADASLTWWFGPAAN